ncbi:hypothetical protein [Phenylobacterium sp.]|uniref:hypothetical protein n=1 Tax=Phenylobacterium sp. TaxID=1871053 RepID=UPI002FC58422
MRVAIVFDPDFGEALIPQAANGAVWLVDTLPNRRLMERLWAGLSEPTNDLTLFDAARAGLETTLASLVHTIDEHHPDWTEFESVGARIEDDTYRLLMNIAPGTLQATARGSLFRKA